jgi:ATP-binding cassette subfamily C protein
MEPAKVLPAVLAMSGSFGPVTALSALSSSLSLTLGAGDRVLSILAEEPVIKEITAYDRQDSWEGYYHFEGARVSHVFFSYGDEEVLSDVSLTVQKGRIIGIHGPSGSGKSTLLKLLMRFYDADSGDILVSGEDIRRIPTNRLRDAESYVTQTTQLFNDTIAENIAIGKVDASRVEIIRAAKKASLDDFVRTLPKGYDTKVGELGDALSGGERQRIGLARAFLHNAPFMLLDEPTSNLDSLNEGIILKALREEAGERTVLLVTHRKSTMKVCDQVAEMRSGRSL